MNKKIVPVFLVLLVVSLACNLGTGSNPSGSTGGDATLAPNPTLADTPSVQAQGISAESPNPQSVLIQWEPMDGAEQYLLEIQVGDEYIPVANMPSSRSSYQDDNVPPATRFTYRLSSLVADQKQESKEITVETQAATIDPIQVGIEFDRSAPLFDMDPNNFDPSTLDPNTIDPNNFDPANFMPQPIEAEAEMGAEGGELSVTGSNGVNYTLVVPPNALRMQVPIKMKPISAISDLPLSGGLMAGVFIEPANLVFDIPVQISMEPPADFAAPAAPLVLAFSFDADGQEFHLYPVKTDSGQSAVAREVASLQWVPNGDPPLSQIAETRYGGGYGQASGTVGDVKKMAKKVPAKSQNRTAQQMAVNQLDDLAPLTTINEDELTPLMSKEEYASAKMAESIHQKAGKADDWGKFLEVMERF